MNQNQLKSLLERPVFDKYQKREIEKGIEDDFSDEKILLYAKPEFEYDQMEQIRWGFCNGLNYEKVSTYAKPEFDSRQMFVIRIGFAVYKLSRKSISLFADPKYSADEMYGILNKLVK